MKVLQIYIRLHLLQIYIHHYVNVAAIATFVLLFSLSIKNFLNFKVNKSKLKKKIFCQKPYFKVTSVISFENTIRSDWTKSTGNTYETGFYLFIILPSINWRHESLQKITFSVKYAFSKCDQLSRKQYTYLITFAYFYGKQFSR